VLPLCGSPVTLFVSRSSRVHRCADDSLIWICSAVSSPLGCEASPSAAVIDTSSVKIVEAGAPRAYDVVKKDQGPQALRHGGHKTASAVSTTPEVSRAVSDQMWCEMDRCVGAAVTRNDVYPPNRRLGLPLAVNLCLTGRAGTKLNEVSRTEGNIRPLRPTSGVGSFTIIDLNALPATTRLCFPPGNISFILLTYSAARSDVVE
jgi:hypothetical protein